MHCIWGFGNNSSSSSSSGTARNSVERLLCRGCQAWQYNDSGAERQFLHPCRG